MGFDLIVISLVGLVMVNKVGATVVVPVDFVVGVEDIVVVNIVVVVNAIVVPMFAVTDHIISSEGQ